MTHHESLVRLPVVKAKRGLGRSSIYNEIRAGLMTRGIELGAGRAKGWPESEIDALNAARVSGKSDDEIRELVKRLEAERKTAFARWEAERNEFPK